MVKDRFTRYIIANREALFKIMTVAPRDVKILISSGAKEIPLGYDVSKYTSSWHSDALVKGQWPDGEAIIDPASNKPLSSCYNSKFNDEQSPCSLDILKEAKDGGHINHMHLYFEKGT